MWSSKVLTVSQHSMAHRLGYLEADSPDMRCVVCCRSTNTAGRSRNAPIKLVMMTDGNLNSKPSLFIFTQPVPPDSRTCWRLAWHDSCLAAPSNM